MEHSFAKILQGYRHFREKYALGDDSVMRYLSYYGQSPEIMVLACCDSRVDPALIMQCDPGDLFVIRNVANIVPPYEPDQAYHGTSAALEFGICFLNVKHLILLGHSQCGGIQCLMGQGSVRANDFISTWVSVLQCGVDVTATDVDACAKLALHHSFKNMLSFPWIQERIVQRNLTIHRWFFDVKTGEIFAWSEAQQEYCPLS